MAVKRTTADRHFSKCVRLRTNWHCEYCDKSFDHDRGSLHCSHYISRNYKIIRFNPYNALAHCFSCHEELGGGRWGGGNNAEFSYHYDNVHGPEIRESLRLMSKYAFPRFKRHEQDISVYYRDIAKEMEEMRMDGETDRIEFDMCQGS